MIAERDAHFDAAVVRRTAFFNAALAGVGLAVAVLVGGAAWVAFAVFALPALDAWLALVDASNGRAPGRFQSLMWRVPLLLLAAWLAMLVLCWFLIPFLDHVR